MEDTEQNFSDFCTELREQTKTTHDKSDKLINLKLAVVLTNKESWGHVLGHFYHVFQTIELCIGQHLDSPFVRPLQMKELRRTDAFEKDLEFYLGTDWRRHIVLSTAAQSYCDRILSASDEDPANLIALVILVVNRSVSIEKGRQWIRVASRYGSPSEKGRALKRAAIT